MKTIRWKILIPVFAGLFGASSVEAASYAVLDGGVDNGGTVSGRITFDGTPPPARMLTVDEDTEACGGDRPSEELLVNNGGGIKNVVLTIEDVQSGKQWSQAEEFVYDQKNCTFVPRILIVKPKAQGMVLNSDSVGHNFHTISKGIYSVNKKMKGGANLKIAQNKIRRAGIIRTKCDIHSWMKGWWFVAKSPYSVLSNENGEFSITNIPAGTYTLKVWHELLGESEQTVVVKANESAEVNVTLDL